MKKIQLLYYVLFVGIVISSCKKDMDKVDWRLPSTTSGLKHDRGFIVIAKEGAKLENIAASLTNLGCKKFVLKESIKELSLIHVQTPDPTFPEKARAVADVQSVVVDVVAQWHLPTRLKSSGYSVSNTPASEYTDKLNRNPWSFLQWDLQAAKVANAWNKGYEGAGAKVAVLDGGFQTKNPDIADNIILKQNFIDGETIDYKGSEGFSHGTNVAGIIAGIDNNLGIVGVAPKAKLILVKVLDDAGSGPFSALINGIYFAATHGANIINMSLGAELPLKAYKDDNGTPDDPSDDFIVRPDKDVRDLIIALNRATVFANNVGATLIAAAGNDGVNYDQEKNFITYPANCIGVLAVSATGPIGWAKNHNTFLYVPASFSNTGKNFISFAASGGSYPEHLDVSNVTVGPVTAPAYVFDWVFGLGFEDNGDFLVGWVAGTSQATPHVSAIAAMIYGKYKQLSSPHLIADILRRSSIDLGPKNRDADYGYGEVDAGKAITY
ncbi:S8 family serine peptidase [Danxiaibacter flavus]|uniref:S8 family serine peptidase n=1 Tax=Danxiaibacter flavus TaxID=3049108 RepID=A0ABV3Z932_9BACT|nr:S8 family serine peptidase [Chitinophagaceae bacterium DXS]